MPLRLKVSIWKILLGIFVAIALFTCVVGVITSLHPPTTACGTQPRDVRVAAMVIVAILPLFLTSAVLLKRQFKKKLYLALTIVALVLCWILAMLFALGVYIGFGFCFTF